MNKENPTASSAPTSKVLSFELIAKTKTPHECRTLAKNCRERGNLAQASAASYRLIELIALKEQPATLLEKRCWEAVAAREVFLEEKHGRKTHASFIRLKIKKHGNIVAAVDSIVARKKPTVGFEELVDGGFEDYLFENVVIAFPDDFSIAAVQNAIDRLSRLPSRHGLAIAA